MLRDDAAPSRLRWRRSRQCHSGLAASALTEVGEPDAVVDVILDLRAKHLTEAAPAKTAGLQFSRPRVIRAAAP
jgi:hypothetical protein